MLVKLQKQKKRQVCSESEVGKQAAPHESCKDGRMAQGTQIPAAKGNNLPRQSGSGRILCVLRGNVQLQKRKSVSLSDEKAAVQVVEQTKPEKKLYMGWLQ